MAANAKPDVQRILLKPRQAAQACSASERWLWQHSQPRGPIPCVRIGGLVRYSLEALQAFIASQQQAPQQTEEEFRQQVEDQFDAALDQDGGLELAENSEFRFVKCTAADNLTIDSQTKKGN